MSALPENPAIAYDFRTLLANLDLKLVLDSPDGDYRFEYFTALSKDREANREVKTRKYRLLDLARGTVTPDPWDAFNLETQARILPGLINWGRYRLTVVTGWKVKCPACGAVMVGAHWKSPPKTCVSNATGKCDEKIQHLVAVQAG
jgi:hypothetical protein